jgi:hypothetical protein
MGMFGTAKPLASLSSGLLARKGQARPAMKPQGYAGFGAATSLDDLGWNDMGDPDPIAEPAATADLPPVLVQREELAAAVVAPEPELIAEPEPRDEPAVGLSAAAAPAPASEPVSITATGRPARDATRAAKAAFTLRLPADRHLRLRLTSAVQRRSAQAVVTDALDRYLASLPEVDDLARQCPPAAPKGDHS